MVSFEPSQKKQHLLSKYREELEDILPADVLCDSNASKETVIDRVTGGSSSLVHFLVHGIAVGKDGHGLFKGEENGIG